MKNINSADNIIFKNKNLWWLFTNIDRSNSGDFSNDFSIFYSKTNPLTNKWKSHPQNPILIIRERYDESADVIKIPLNDFHQWLRPGFCVTIDSSQGRTIREKYTLWQIQHPFMTRSRRYVAVSRATRKQDVQVVNCSLADLMDEMTRIPVRFR